VQSKVFTTITDINGNGADSADEVLSESWADGAGRVRRSRSELPNSIGGYSGSLVEYNILGQVKRSTVPTEINSSWLPAGDDANRGFLWMQHEYDWKGRATKETNTDGTFKSFGYNGCGCAGGQVTTIQGELLAEGRRTQKVYADILGRTFKTETLNWDGSVYSSSTTTFDGADRPKFARQFEGTAILNRPHQTTMMTYDGFGRLKTEHRPEQDNGTATTYNYLSDGRIQNMIDARGAMTNYTYLSNTGLNAGVLSQVSYSVPSGSNISVTPSVNYTYNNLGMQVSMTDGVGNVGYVYNNLGQMTSENRQFNDSLPNSPSGGFKLEYDYAMNGQLKSLKDPFGQQINYAFDKVGRLNNVSGTTAFVGVTNYANTPSYTAFGALKSMNYGNGTQMSLTFNNRLQANHFELKQADQTPIMQKNYDYYADGKMRYLQDLQNPTFDRLNTFDQIGRPKEAKSGGEARGETVLPVNRTNDLPYRQSYEFNAFSNMTQRNNLHWGVDVSPENFLSFNLNYTYQNNRITNTGFQYDADGRNLQTALPDTNSTTTYDAKGQAITQADPLNNTNLRHSFDGNGGEAKRISVNGVGSGSQTTKTYFIKSSVSGGQTVTEYSQTITTNNSTSTKTRYKSYVRAAGTVLAFQLKDLGSQPTQKVNFQHYDASGMSYKTTLPSGQAVGDSFRQHEGSPAEMDTLGGNVGLSTPYAQDPPPIPEAVYRNLFSDSEMWVNGQMVTCMIDGSAASCAQANSMLASGSGVQVVPVSGSYTRRDKVTGNIISSGAFVVNSGVGVGMMAASALSSMGMITGSVTHTRQQQNNILAQFGTWGSYFSAVFNPSQSNAVAYAERQTPSNRNSVAAGGSDMGVSQSGMNPSWSNYGSRDFDIFWEPLEDGTIDTHFDLDLRSAIEADLDSLRIPANYGSPSMGNDDQRKRFKKYLADRKTQGIREYEYCRGSVMAPVKLKVQQAFEDTGVPLTGSYLAAVNGILTSNGKDVSEKGRFGGALSSVPMFASLSLLRVKIARLTPEYETAGADALVKCASLKPR
jgi:YD repeat-containing protein